MLIKKTVRKVVVFDFDDTLFPTSAIQGRFYREEGVGDEMGALSYLVHQIVSSLLREGARIYVVTLSGEQWVKEQCDAFLPFLAGHFKTGAVGLRALWPEYSRLVTTGTSHVRAAIQVKTDAMSNIVRENIKCTRFFTVGDSSHDHVSMEVALDEIHAGHRDEMVVRHSRTKFMPRLTIPYIGTCLISAWRAASDFPSAAEPLEPITIILSKGAALCPKSCDAWEKKNDSFTTPAASSAA